MMAIAALVTGFFAGYFIGRTDGRLDGLKKALELFNGNQGMPPLPPGGKGSHLR